MRCVFLISLGLWMGSAKAQFYNGSQMEFGKNRVQYRGFMWQTHNYERFKIYYYGSGKTHSVYVAQAAQKFLQEIEKRFDFYLDDKIEFIIYNSQSQFRQSNIGLTGEEQYNIGGVTQIVGSKVFLYYEGDHQQFDQQIKAGIAHVLIRQMMYGGSWRDVFKNSTLLSLPDWYLQGFIAYVSTPWNVETESYVKDGVLSNRYSRFYRLSGLDAGYAGHAIWNYVAEVYGENRIPNILYMTRMSRSIENGFLIVLGVSLRKISDDYIEYYRMKFLEDEKIQDAPVTDHFPIKNKKNTVYYQYKLSPDNRYAAFVSNQMGQYKIWLYDVSTKKHKRLLKGEHKLNRLNDYTYPVLGWHPGGRSLSYVLEKKGETYLCIYDVETGKTSERPLPRLDKVLSFDYSDDGKTLVFSAVALGQTDLYLFRPLGGALDQLTDDIYDDLHPRFVDGSTGVIFASNRPTDTLHRKTPEVRPISNKKDIFIMELNSRSRVLKRITETPHADELYPAQLDSTSYTFLSDENGIYNRYRASYDSTINFVDTIVHYRYFTRTAPLSNYNRNVLEYNVNSKKGTYSYLMLQEGTYRFYKGYVKDDNYALGLIPDTRYRMQQRMAALRAQQPLRKDSVRVQATPVISPPSRDTTQREGIIDINNYQFNDERPVYEKETVVFSEESPPKKKPGDTTRVSSTAKSDPGSFTVAPQALYKLNFATDEVVTQLDNTYLSQTYQRYTPGAAYFNPGINFLFKLGITDVFEDYRVVGGFRFAGNFGSNEFMLSLYDLSKRTDKQYSFYRQAFNAYNRDMGVTKTFIHEFKTTLRYPFSEVLSLRGTLSYRNDKVVTLATDFRNLEVPNRIYHMAGSKAELVFDNTIPRGLNLFNGMRAKVWGEYYREFITEQSNFIVTGFDVRHYQKIHRDLIWANRLAGSASLGSKRLVYFLGGVDNWIAPRFDPAIQVATDQNYAYQALATPVRGFLQNARNGSNFMAFNSELRFPIFKYFAERPIKSDFVENFQLMGFFDAGTAWTGWNPYDASNSFNTTVVSSPGSPLYITLENQREPIVYGYGWGVRSRILGYFIRFDWAWGVDDGVRYKSVKYLSLSLDF